jgi:hypothetical protein
VANENNAKRGWEGLEEKLLKQGVNGIEIEEARDSFCKGIETLTKLFMSCYLPDTKINQKENK